MTAPTGPMPPGASRALSAPIPASSAASTEGPASAEEPASADDPGLSRGRLDGAAFGVRRPGHDQQAASRLEGPVDEGVHGRQAQVRMNGQGVGAERGVRPQEGLGVRVVGRSHVAALGVDDHQQTRTARVGDEPLTGSGIPASRAARRRPPGVSTTTWIEPLAASRTISANRSRPSGVSSVTPQRSSTSPYWSIPQHSGPNVARVFSKRAAKVGVARFHSADRAFCRVVDTAVMPGAQERAIAHLASLAAGGPARPIVAGHAAFSPRPAHGQECQSWSGWRGQGLPVAVRDRDQQWRPDRTSWRRPLAVGKPDLRRRL